MRGPLAPEAGMGGLCAFRAAMGSLAFPARIGGPLAGGSGTGGLFALGGAARVAQVRAPVS